MNLYRTSKELDSAILVGVNVTESELDELEALCFTCGIRTAGRVVQQRKDVDVTFYIGRGKVDEVKSLVQSQGATCVVFDVELSGSKVRNLEDALGVSVLDRSKVILDIFAQRAQSNEGKMQVELAQLKYNSTRLVGSGGLMAKMKTSVGMRGPGEKKLELDKRTIRDQITALEGKLRKLSAHRDLSRSGAAKSGKPRICIVGYTNSGKSTLLNTIAKAGVVAEDKLFATLDPKTANVYIQGTDCEGVQVLLTDTVGFINKLPHEFIRAFESTLDEARRADLLLHVVDVSNQNYHNQIKVVDEVLNKIGADHIPVIVVYNKTDLNQNFSVPDKTSVVISAKQNHGIDELKRKILDFVKAG